MNMMLVLLVLGTPTVDSFVRPEVSASSRAAPTVGLFPIWENTGVVLGHAHLALGVTQVAGGIKDRIHIGLNPLRFAFRTPNIGVKVALFANPWLRVAVSLDALWLMPGSSDVFSTSNISTRLDLRDKGQFAFPVALSGSFALGSEVMLHATVTGLTTYSNRTDAWLGVSAVCEWRPLNHHAISAHLTEVGLWRHDFVQFGGSYRYQRDIFEGRIGVAYQLRTEGALVVPSLFLGVEL